MDRKTTVQKMWAAGASANCWNRLWEAHLATPLPAPGTPDIHLEAGQYARGQADRAWARSYELMNEIAGGQK